MLATARDLAEVFTLQAGVYSEIYMSYSLNPLKGVIYGIIQGTTIVLIKGDTMSLDHSSFFSIEGPT